MQSLEDREHSHSTIADRIYAFLKRQILTCKLLPGERLNEKELCAEFSASRTPLREALNRLASEQLIHIGNYRGYLVAPITISDVIELSELRCIVEGNAAALAAERATSTEIEHLFSLAVLSYEPGDRETYEQYLNSNNDFHFAIASCARNQKLLDTVVSILHQIHRPLYLGLDVGLDPASATAEHLDVVDAISKRDRAAAQLYMKRNAEHSRDRMLKALTETQFANRAAI